MTGGIAKWNLIIGVAGLALCVLGLVQTVSSRVMEKRTRRYFILFFSFLVAYVAANLVGQFGSGVTPIKIPIFLESLFSSILTLLLTAFLLERSGETDWSHNRAFHVAAGMEAVYLALLVYTQFSTLIYYFDAQKLYHRGPYYPLLLVPPVCIMAVNLVVLLNRRSRLSPRERRAFAVYILAPMICMLFQMLFFGLYVIVLGSSVAAMVMFCYIQNDQEERYYAQQEENAQLKIDILLAQIQPHFIFNSLTTIKYLCRKDPVQAEEAIAEFIAYLRHNMDSLSQDKPLPFEEELKHVERYLDLQKLRFEDELTVKYDLECTDFTIPVLTLQPLVENAVTYGVRRSDSGAGVVTIKTRRYEDRIEVSVMDDGPGFVYEVLPDDPKRSHTGIRNVQERLMRVAGAELLIDSVIGKGTTVTIRLPQEEREC